MSESYPECIDQFLLATKRSNELKAEQKKIKHFINDLKPQVQEWLRDKPDCEYKLHSSEKYGDPGKLRFVCNTSKEPITKGMLKSNLLSFFSSVFVDKSEEDVSRLVDAAVEHVWMSRKSVTGKPSVTRTVSKKNKKRKLT